MKGEKWRFSGKEEKVKRSKLPEPGGGIPPILLWIWQDAVTNLTVKTLQYSEFKEHVRKGEVNRS